PTETYILSLHALFRSADGNRDRLRHDGAAAGGPARCPRPDGQRPCRRAGVALMEWTRHLLAVPILLPLATGAALLLIDELRHTADRKSTRLNSSHVQI